MLSAATAEEVKTTTSTTKSESQTMVPHEYIRDNLTFRYGECKSCGTRTEFTCIKCGYCYSCHWKKEELQRQFNNNKPEIFSPLLKSGRKNGLTEEERQKEEQLQGQKQQQQQHQQRIVNIFGQVSEPICAYHHKFSLHGSSRCRCRHPTNRTLGIFMGYP